MADLYNSSHTGAEIDQAVSDVQDNKQAWAEKDIFIATYETTTFAEIKAAYDAGKAVFCKYGVIYLVPLTDIRDTRMGFYSVMLASLSYTQFFRMYCNADDTWSSSATNLVPLLRRINGKSLASDITLGAMYSATLTASGWTTSGAWKTQTVSVTGLKATYNAAPFVDVTLTGTDAAGDAELAAAWLGISETLIADTAANSITVKFPATVDTPTANIPITITTYD